MLCRPHSAHSERPPPELGPSIVTRKKRYGPSSCIAVVSILHITAPPPSRIPSSRSCLRSTRHVPPSADPSNLQLRGIPNRSLLPPPPPPPSCCNPLGRCWESAPTGRAAGPGSASARDSTQNHALSHSTDAHPTRSIALLRPPRDANGGSRRCECAPVAHSDPTARTSPTDAGLIQPGAVSAVEPAADKGECGAAAASDAPRAATSPPRCDGSRPCGLQIHGER
eukprot:2792478-Rhodomonas_salina.2